MHFKAPRRPRELFHLLAMLAEMGEDELLDRIEWRDVTPRQVYAAFLDRLPESAAVAIAGPDYAAREHARTALRSPEFQETIVRRLLDAFPEKQRLLSVHIPRAADADLFGRLSGVFAAVHQSWSAPEQTPPEALQQLLCRFALETLASEAVLVGGFYPLSFHVSSRLYRPQDRIFAVLRHPYEIVLAACNEVFRMLELAGQAEPGQEPDPALAAALAPWAEILGRDRLPPGTPPPELRRLSLRMLAHPERIGGGHPLCTYLGEGTAASALDLMARCDIELVLLPGYAEWLQSTWGLRDAAPPELAEGVMRLGELGPQQRKALTELCEEDMRLYSRITDRMEARGTTRLFGPDLI
jgi:hypothetical protein